MEDRRAAETDLHDGPPWLRVWRTLHLVAALVLPWGAFVAAERAFFDPNWAQDGFQVSVVAFGVLLVSAAALRMTGPSAGATVGVVLVLVCAVAVYTPLWVAARGGLQLTTWQYANLKDWDGLVFILMFPAHFMFTALILASVAMNGLPWRSNRE